jgi:hypothetical protein
MRLTMAETKRLARSKAAWISQARKNLHKIRRLSSHRLRSNRNKKGATFFAAASLNSGLALACLRRAKNPLWNALGATVYSMAAMHAFYDGERVMGRDPLKSKVQGV